MLASPDSRRLSLPSQGGTGGSGADGSASINRGGNEVSTKTGDRPSAAAMRASGERVRNAAARLFRERGYASTTMRDVAEHAEMQAGSIYYYYPSKQEMLRAVLDHVITTLTRRTLPLLTDDGGTMNGAITSYRKRFRTAIREHMLTTIEMGDYALSFRRLVNELPDDVRRDFAEKRSLLDEKWRLLLANAARNGEIRDDVDLGAVRLLLVGAVNSTSEWFNPDRGSLDSIADIVTAMVFDGLAAQR